MPRSLNDRSRWILAMAVSALFGCGGGGAERGAPQQAFAAQLSAGEVTPAPRLRALTAKAAANPGGAAPVPVTAAELFDWAQQIYPSVFPAGPQNQAVTAGGIAYTLRYYPSTDSYLAVGDADGVVYGLGAFTGHEIRSFGKLVDYTCDVRGNCAQPLGKHRYTTPVDGDTREYYVHVPTRYTGSAPTAVVLMLHGSGGDGDKFYNISGWVETGEAQNILTVYPSSWTYKCVLDDGENKKGASKWNAFGLTMCDASDHARDDLKFLGQVLDDVQNRFSVDPRRMYVVGFSSGAEMAARSGVDLGDRLAAVVAQSGFLDHSYLPKRLTLPVGFMFGNEDAKVQAHLGIDVPLPMDFAQLYSSYPLARTSLSGYMGTFGIADAYTVSGAPATTLLANYKGLSGLPGNLFVVAMVKGLKHVYPNGINHPMRGADEHWAWMKGFTLP